MFGNNPVFLQKVKKDFLLISDILSCFEGLKYFLESYKFLGLVYSNETTKKSILSRLKKSIFSLLQGNVELPLALKIAQILRIFYKQRSFLMPNDPEEKNDLICLIRLLKKHDIPDVFNLRNFFIFCLIFSFIIFV